ncbi:unnamed protein product [Closterium sp. Yama58-4]|nr:unnamed protein product [Closterium sp. Yama58-4]
MSDRSSSSDEATLTDAENMREHNFPPDVVSTMEVEEHIERDADDELLQEPDDAAQLPAELGGVGDVDAGGPSESPSYRNLREGCSSGNPSPLECPAADAISSRSPSSRQAEEASRQAVAQPGRPDDSSERRQCGGAPAGDLPLVTAGVAAEIGTTTAAATTGQPPMSQRRAARQRLALLKRRIPRDGYMWLKYGQKQLTGGTHGRHYYRCSHFRQPTECRARRVVDFHKHDSKLPLRISFFGEHNHPPHHPPQLLAAPPQTPSAAAAQPASAGATAVQASSAAATAPRSSRHPADRLRLSLPDDVIGSALAGGASAASAGGGGSGPQAAGAQPGGSGRGDGGKQAEIPAGVGGRLPYSLAELEALAAVLREAAAASAAAGNAHAPPMEGSSGRANVAATNNSATSAAAAATNQRVLVNVRACASSLGSSDGGGSIRGSSRAVAAEREHQLLESLVNLLTSPVASPGSGSASLTRRPSSAPSPRDLHSPMQTGSLLSPTSAVAAAYPHCASYPSYRSPAATSPSSMTSASGSTQYSPHAKGPTGPMVHTGTRFGVPSSSPRAGAPFASAGPSAQSQQQLAAAAILAHLLTMQSRQGASPRTPNPVHETHRPAPAPLPMREAQGVAPAPRTVHEAQGGMHQPHAAIQQPLNAVQGGLVSPPRPALSCPPEGRVPAPPPLFIPRPASSPAEYFSASAAISSPRGTSVNCQVSTWPPAQEHQASQPWAAGQGFGGCGTGFDGGMGDAELWQGDGVGKQAEVGGVAWRMMEQDSGALRVTSQLLSAAPMADGSDASGFGFGSGTSQLPESSFNGGASLNSSDSLNAEAAFSQLQRQLQEQAKTGNLFAFGNASTSAAAGGVSRQQRAATNVSPLQVHEEDSGKEREAAGVGEGSVFVSQPGEPLAIQVDTGRANGSGSSCLFNNQSGYYAGDAAAGGEGNIRYASSDLPGVFHHSPDLLQKQIQDTLDQQELDAAMLAAVTAGTVGVSAGAGSAGEITVGENGCGFYGSGQAASHSQSGGFGCDVGSGQQQHSLREEQNGGTENLLAMMALLRTLTDPDDHMTLDGSGAPAGGHAGAHGYGGGQGYTGGGGSSGYGGHGYTGGGGAARGPRGGRAPYVYHPSAQAPSTQAPPVAQATPPPPPPPAPVNPAVAEAGARAVRWLEEAAEGIGADVALRGAASDSGASRFPTAGGDGLPQEVQLISRVASLLQSPMASQLLAWEPTASRIWMLLERLLAHRDAVIQSAAASAIGVAAAVRLPSESTPLSPAAAAPPAVAISFAGAERLFAWALPQLTDPNADVANTRLALLAAAPFCQLAPAPLAPEADLKSTPTVASAGADAAAAAAAAAASEPYVSSCVQACQGLLEDEGTPPTLLPPILSVLVAVAERFPRTFLQQFEEIIDLLLGWAMEPSVLPASRQLIGDCFLRFGRQWREKGAFTRNVLLKLVGDIETEVKAGKGSGDSGSAGGSAGAGGAGSASRAAGVSGSGGGGGGGGGGRSRPAAMAAAEETDASDARLAALTLSFSAVLGGVTGWRGVPSPSTRFAPSGAEVNVGVSTGGFPMEGVSSGVTGGSVNGRFTGDAAVGQGNAARGQDDESWRQVVPLESLFRRWLVLLRDLLQVDIKVDSQVDSQVEGGDGGKALPVAAGGAGMGAGGERAAAGGESVGGGGQVRRVPVGRAGVARVAWVAEWWAVLPVFVWALCAHGGNHLQYSWKEKEQQQQHQEPLPRFSPVQQFLRSFYVPAVAPLLNAIASTRLFPPPALAAVLRCHLAALDSLRGLCVTELQAQLGEVASAKPNALDQRDQQQQGREEEEPENLVRDGKEGDRKNIPVDGKGENGKKLSPRRSIPADPLAAAFSALLFARPYAPLPLLRLHPHPAVASAAADTLLSLLAFPPLTLLPPPSFSPSSPLSHCLSSSPLSVPLSFLLAEMRDCYRCAAPTTHCSTTGNQATGRVTGEGSTGAGQQRRKRRRAVRPRECHTFSQGDSALEAWCRQHAADLSPSADVAEWDWTAEEAEVLLRFDLVALSSGVTQGALLCAQSIQENTAAAAAAPSVAQQMAAGISLLLRALVSDYRRWTHRLWPLPRCQVAAFHGLRAASQAAFHGNRMLLGLGATSTSTSIIITAANAATTSTCDIPGAPVTAGAGDAASKKPESKGFEKGIEDVTGNALMGKRTRSGARGTSTGALVLAELALSWRDMAWALQEGEACAGLKLEALAWAGGDQVAANRKAMQELLQKTLLSAAVSPTIPRPLPLPPLHPLTPTPSPLASPLLALTAPSLVSEPPEILRGPSSGEMWLLKAAASGELPVHLASASGDLPLKPHQLVAILNLLSRKQSTSAQPPHPDWLLRILLTLPSSPPSTSSLPSPPPLPQPPPASSQSTSASSPDAVAADGELDSWRQLAAVNGELALSL